MTRANFDAIVLGAGSGGLATALRAARHGAKVALLEPRDLGGTCVNVGCVPKKVMWLAAKLAETQKLARDVGFASTPGDLDWTRYVAQRERYIERIHASYRQQLAEAGIELIPEYGHFIGAHRIATTTRILDAAHIVIASGARPRVAEVPGAQLGIDSNGFFALRACPRRVAVVGGGYIAVELAGILHALGSEVEMFVRGSKLLEPFDDEICDELVSVMRGRGIGIGFGQRINALTADDAGSITPIVEGARSDGSFDALIWALGRVPNTGSLGLDVAGIETDKEGHVIVDAVQDTNVVGVHAVGDVTDKLALTPVATASGRHLADRLFGGMADAHLDFANIPTVVFASVPLASVGLSEQAARQRHGASVQAYRTRFKPMINALSGCDEKTFMKLVCVGEEERVVGVHLLGKDVDEMLQGFAVAVKLGARKADFEATVAIHPSAAEEVVLMR